MTPEGRRTTLETFATKHGLTLEDHGEVGFGRSAVGFTIGGGYIDFNPLDMETYDHIQHLYSDRLKAPEGVHAYHKHYCLCVLVDDENYGVALDQLVLWVEHLNAVGVEVATYPTPRNTVSAMMGQRESYALKVIA